jgi:dihydrofolate reductase
MRTVTYGAACSLDGFIAAADGGIDWLHFSKDVQQYMAAFWPTIDTILMGRLTWEVSARQQPDDGAATPGIATYVFSRTLSRIDRKGVELVRDDAVKFVGDLKRTPGKGICVMGGGVLGTALIEGGVVDVIGLNVHPVLLGSGIPLFRDPHRRVPLQLSETRRLAGGCVLSTYRVKERGATQRTL